MDLILKYFPDLTSRQKEQYAALFDLYNYWNGQINVISRKDIDQLYLRHVLHSLAIAKVCSFSAGSRIMDVGTGGGFPGIPLAIMFPEAEFTLIDSIGKKIKVVEEVAKGAGLENVTAVHGRAEQQPDAKFDYVVSRAVTDMKAFTGWVWNKIRKQDRSGSPGQLSNGILYLKGGDLEGGLGEELAAVKKPYAFYEISDFFGEEFFDTKKIVYIPR